MVERTSCGIAFVVVGVLLALGGVFFYNTLTWVLDAHGFLWGAVYFGAVLGFGTYLGILIVDRIGR